MPVKNRARIITSRGARIHMRGFKRDRIAFHQSGKEFLCRVRCSRHDGVAASGTSPGGITRHHAYSLFTASRIIDHPTLRRSNISSATHSRRREQMSKSSATGAQSSKPAAIKPVAAIRLRKGARAKTRCESTTMLRAEERAPGKSHTCSPRPNVKSRRQ
jgi:hypothetical protein